MPWNVQLLGTPAAHCNGRTARLRSKQTWAVLASLLLDHRLDFRQGTANPYASPPRLSRLMLANRFWGDKDDPRTHLRQAVASLREVFEEFVVESDAIQTMPY